MKNIFKVFLLVFLVSNTVSAEGNCRDFSYGLIGLMMEANLIIRAAELDSGIMLKFIECATPEEMARAHMKAFGWRFELDRNSGKWGKVIKQ